MHFQYSSIISVSTLYSISVTVTRYHCNNFPSMTDLNAIILPTKLIACRIEHDGISVNYCTRRSGLIGLRRFTNLLIEWLQCSLAYHDLHLLLNSGCYLLFRSTCKDTETAFKSTVIRGFVLYFSNK